MRKGDRAVLQAGAPERLTEGAPEQETGRPGWIARDFDVAPGDRPGEPRPERLQRSLPGGEPRRQVHPRALLGPAVRQLRRAERVGQQVVAPVEARLEGRDVDEIDADPHGAARDPTPSGPRG